MYKDWVIIVSNSSLDTPHRSRMLLELNSRLTWLQQRQEFIRVEVERGMKEVQIGHHMLCTCQGLSAWVDLD
jgi:hypothetical protein